MILTENIPETHGPLGKGRSDEAAEDQGNRFFTAVVGEFYRILTVGIAQLEIWSNIPGFRCKEIVLFLPGLV